MNNISIGKQMPHAPELERAVLGALLVDSNSLDRVRELISEALFYDKKNKLIYQSINVLFEKFSAIDTLTVCQQLKKEGNIDIVGGAYSITMLTDNIGGSANLESHVGVLLDMYVKRELIKNSDSIIKSSYEGNTDTFDLLEKAYDHLGNVHKSLVPNKEIKIMELTDKIIERGDKIYRGIIKAGIETPIKKLTNSMGGWKPSDLIIIAARPGMGKTAFALKSAWVSAKAGNPSAYFSLEMSANSLMSRLISMECKIEGDKFNMTGLNKENIEKIKEFKKTLNKIPFYIDDNEIVDIQMLRIKAKKLKKEKGIKLLVVDYIQLMESKKTKGNREQEMANISRGLKLLAKELDIPVIALSQLSRAVEKRGGNKRPMLSDLRESGALEQDTDIVQFLYRPEYYGEKQWDDYDQMDCQNEAEYIIAKNRNGALCRNRMQFISTFTDFIDLEVNENSDYFNSFKNAVEPNESF